MKVLIAALLLLVGAVSAQAENFSGKINAGMIVINNADNLSARGNKSIDSITAKPKSITHVYPFPTFDLNYRQDASANSYYLRTDQGEVGSLAAGVRHDLHQGAIDASLFYSLLGEEWENPYVLRRTATDAPTFGFRLAYDNIAGSGVAVSYKVSLKEIDKDVIGTLNADLERDGTIHRLGASYGMRLTESIVMSPSLAYERGAIDGAANSHHTGEGALELVWRGGRVMWINRFSGTYATFDQTHPLYGKARREPGYSVGSTAVFMAPCGMKRTALTLGFKHDRTFSNIDFFGSNSTAGFALVGYSF